MGPLERDFKQKRRVVFIVVRTVTVPPLQPLDRGTPGPRGGVPLGGERSVREGKGRGRIYSSCGDSREFGIAYFLVSEVERELVNVFTN